MLHDILKDLGKEVKKGKMTWQEVADVINEKLGMELTSNAVRKRYTRMLKSENKLKIENNSSEYETYYNDGVVEAQKIVNLPKDIKKDPQEVLKVMGYDPNEWEVVFMTFSNWQQHTREQETKELYAVKFKLKPKTKDLTLTDSVEIAKEVFKKEIKPIKLPKKVISKELNNDVMIEYPAIELHLGKMAVADDVGEDYNYKIASDRFNRTIEKTLQTQEIARAGTLFMCIGSDFFNTDTTFYTTTRGTPQDNDLRWKKMFLVGLELYKNALITLREKFNKIDIQLVQGNHDEMASFYLYIALQQYFKNDKTITFSNDLKKVQCYEFGKCVIFTHHGDKNLKRLIKSIPAEFYQEWGKSIHRELHLGHLHKEVVVDDESGLLTRRIGSPAGTDEWHYNERCVGATPKHQIFIWHKEKGLLSIQYINFSKKKLNNAKTLEI
jgi:hypothetical protein